MRAFKIIRLHQGQALSEMVLSVPLLFLFAAGIIQFSTVFLSYVQFEHACGEAARQYAAGVAEKNSIERNIWDNLGPYRRYFEAESLSASLQEPRATASRALEIVQRSIGILPYSLNYKGAEWAVKIRCRPPFFFSALFPRGLLFETIFQVVRYPS